jgi:hypothetical protein
MASALIGGERSTSRPGRFTRVKERRYSLTGRLVWLHSRSGCFWGKRKLSCSTGIQNPDHPDRSLFTIPTELSRLLLVSAAWTSPSATLLNSPSTRLAQHFIFCGQLRQNLVWMQAKCNVTHRIKKKKRISALISTMLPLYFSIHNVQ